MAVNYQNFFMQWTCTAIKSLIHNEYRAQSVRYLVLIIYSQFFKQERMIKYFYLLIGRFVLS